MPDCKWKFDNFLTFFVEKTFQLLSNFPFCCQKTAKAARRRPKVQNKLEKTALSQLARGMYAIGKNIAGSILPPHEATASWGPLPFSTCAAEVNSALRQGLLRKRLYGAYRAAPPCGAPVGNMLTAVLQTLRSASWQGGL